MIIGGMWIQILRHSNTRFSNAEYASIFQESQACVHGNQGQIAIKYMYIIFSISTILIKTKKQI